MKKINLRDYYPYYTQDMIVEVPDEVALLLREYMLLEEAYRIRTYRYKAFYSLDRDEGIEREILQKPLNPAEIWEQRQMTELIYKGLSKLPVKQRQRIYAHFFLGMSKADIAKAEGTHKSRITRSIEAGLRSLEKYFKAYTSSHPNCNINSSAMPLACSLTTEYTLLQVLHSVFRAADGAAR